MSNTNNTNAPNNGYIPRMGGPTSPITISPRVPSPMNRTAPVIPIPSPMNRTAPAIPIPQISPRVLSPMNRTAPGIQIASPQVLSPMNRTAPVIPIASPVTISPRVLSPMNKNVQQVPFQTRVPAMPVLPRISSPTKTIPIVTAPRPISPKSPRLDVNNGNPTQQETIKITDLPIEIQAMISEYSRNTKNALISRDFMAITADEKHRAFNNPEEYIKSLHPNVKHLIQANMYRNRIFKRACKRNRVDIIEIFPEEYLIRNADIGLRQAIKGIHRNLITYFIDLGAGDFDRAMKCAGKTGDRELIEFLINLGLTDYSNLSNALIGAASKGFTDLIEYLINQEGYDFNTLYLDTPTTLELTIMSAAKGGYQNIIDMLITMGVRDHTYALGLYGAIPGKNRDLINFFFQRTNMNETFPVALKLASRQEDIDLINFILAYKRRVFSQNGVYEDGQVPPTRQELLLIFRGVIGVGNIELANAALARLSLTPVLIGEDELIRQNNQGYEWKVLEMEDIDSNLKYAIKGGNERIINFFLDRTNDYDYALYVAAKYNNVNLIRKLIEKGAKDLNQGLRGAAAGGHQELVQAFIDAGANDINTGLIMAVNSGIKSLVEYFIRLRANELNRGLLMAIRGGHDSIARLLIENGANNIEEAIRTATEYGNDRLARYLRGL